MAFAPSSKALDAKAPKHHTLCDWLAWLETRHSSEIDLGLERVRVVAERLDVVEFSAKVITVAGTNGKGSYVKAMSELLSSCELHFGAYTSPHIERYNERIALNGKPVDDSVICDAFEKINLARKDISLTYFEFGTLAALLIFKQIKLDVILLEVGLGGRLDAVNIIDPDIAVITSIGLDHQDWLGDTRELIGREKAGILRKGIPCICVDLHPPQSVINAVEEHQCTAFFFSKALRQHQTATESLFELSESAEPLALIQPKLPVPSLVAAAQTYLLLDGQMSIKEVGRILSQTELEGRFERIRCGQNEFILDVAHNPQAAEHLARQIACCGLSNLVCVIAAMKDKDIKGILEPLDPYIQTWVCTEIPSLARSLDSNSMQQRVNKQARSVSVSDPVEAIEEAIIRANEANQEKSPILVLGSFFLISEFKTRYLPKVIHP